MKMEVPVGAPIVHVHMTKEKLDTSVKRQNRAKRVSLIKYFDKAKTTKSVDTKTRSSLGQNQFIENYKR